MHKGSALLSTLMILFGVIVVAFFGLDIIVNGLTRRRAEGASEKALAAAESGAEMALSALKYNKASFFTCTSTPGTEFYYNFSSNNCIATTTAGLDNINNAKVYFANNSLLPAYAAKVTFKPYAVSNPQNVLVVSRGMYMDVAREIRVNFCLPDCFGKTVALPDDGCGGKCVCSCAGRHDGDDNGCGTACDCKDENGSPIDCP